ncbi:MAG: hypothetical protein ACRCYU_17965 [Nocardioides sp.]
MSVVLGVLVVLAAFAAGIWVITVTQPNAVDQWRRERLIRSARRADAQVTQTAQDARRAMNRAAGQSWRNRFE